MKKSPPDEPTILTFTCAAPIKSKAFGGSRPLLTYVIDAHTQLIIGAAIIIPEVLDSKHK